MGVRGIQRLNRQVRELRVVQDPLTTVDRIRDHLTGHSPGGRVVHQDAEERVARNTAVNVTISVEETVVEIDTTDIGSP